MIQSKLFNIDIEKYLKSQPCKFFKGVFSSDNIPFFSGNFVVVCNLSNVREIGSHFVVIGRLEGTIVYLDSLSLNWVNGHLKWYLNKISSSTEKITVLNHPVQSPLSQGCGVYCIFFVLLFHSMALPVTPPLIKFDRWNNNDSICLKNIDILVEFLK